MTSAWQLRKRRNQMKLTLAFFAGIAAVFAALGAWGVACALGIESDDAFDSDGDDLPWECGPVVCGVCGCEAIAVTHWPAIRRDMECPDCGAMALCQVEPEMN